MCETPARHAGDLAAVDASPYRLPKFAHVFVFPEQVQAIVVLPSSPELPVAGTMNRNFTPRAFLGPTRLTTTWDPRRGL